jgi:MFS transporter, DHA2 family, multidrug resistance protein
LGAVPSKAAQSHIDRVDRWGMALLVVATGSLQLALQRNIDQIWPPSLESATEFAVAVAAGAVIAFQSCRSRFTLFRFEVFRDVNFATATVYNFLVGALLFTTIVFVPALAEGPLASNATQAGLVISPRGFGTMAMMLAMRHLIDRIDHRALLALGLLITAGALALMARVPLHDGAVWLAATSAAQGIGIGLVFTPLSTTGFWTLAPELRTDATGIYNLTRQLGCATGVAVMTGVLRARIHIRLSDLQPNGGIAVASTHILPTISFAAYTDCFRVLAMLALAMTPGVLLLRGVCRDEKGRDRPAPARCSVAAASDRAFPMGRAVPGNSVETERGGSTRDVTINQR